MRYFSISHKDYSRIPKNATFYAVYGGRSYKCTKVGTFSCRYQDGYVVIKRYCDFPKKFQLLVSIRTYNKMLNS